MTLLEEIETIPRTSLFVIYINFRKTHNKKQEAIKHNPTSIRKPRKTFINIRKPLTRDLGKISARSFLYRFTGLRELDLRAGQQTHMLPQAGNIFREITPIFSVNRKSNNNKKLLY